MVAGFPLALQADAAELEPWAKGAQSPFILPAVEGADVALAAPHDGIVLVHFFATWCEPCREELPALARFANRGGSSVKVLAISVAEVDGRVQRFVASMPVTFPVLLDRDRGVARSWQVATLPTTFVLDADLNPRLFVETDYAWDLVDPKKLIAASGVVGPDLLTAAAHQAGQEEATHAHQ